MIVALCQAKGKERQWLKHQTYGDLDEAKLIEGLTGERSIYKRRGEKEPEVSISGFLQYLAHYKFTMLSCTYSV